MKSQTEKNQIVEVIQIEELKERYEPVFSVSERASKTLTTNHTQITAPIEIPLKTQIPSDKKPIRRDDISIHGRVVRLRHLSRRR